MEHELPYLVYASDAEEFRGSVDALGLVMHVAVMPHLFPIPEQFTKETGIEAWPWAFGHVLYARFSVVEDAQ